MGTEFARLWPPRITFVRFSPVVGAICRPPMSKITSFHPIQAKRHVRYHIPQTNASVFCNHAFRRLDRRGDLLQNLVERTVPPSNTKLKAPWALLPAAIGLGSPVRGFHFPCTSGGLVLHQSQGAMHVATIAGRLPRAPLRTGFQGLRHRTSHRESQCQRNRRESPLPAKPRARREALPS